MYKITDCLDLFKAEAFAFLVSLEKQKWAQNN